MGRNKRWSSIFLISASLLIAPCYSYADAMGADLKILSEMYMNMKKQLDQLKQQVDQLKATNDSLRAAQSDINDLRHEYYFVKNFDPNADINNLKYWANGEIGLSNLSGDQTLDQKWSVINNVINKRFTEPGATPSYAQDPQKKEIDALLAQMKKNEQQQLNYLKQAEAADQNSSTKDLAKVSASSNAMLASLALEKKQKELQDEIQRREVLLNQMQQDYSFVQYLGKN